MALVDDVARLQQEVASLRGEVSRLTHGRVGTPTLADISEHLGLPKLNLPDGIAAPASIAGIAQLYLDKSDGALAVKRADGALAHLATGLIKRSTAIACAVYRSTDFTHNSSGSFLAVSFDRVRTDADGMFKLAQNTRLTARRDGFYAAMGHLNFAVNTTGLRGAGVRLNGSTFLDQQLIGALSGEDMRVHTFAAYLMLAGHYFELMGYQSSGGNLAITATGNRSPEFQVWRVA